MITFNLLNIFSFYWESDFYWFRLFGYGLKCKNINKYRLLFSERNGHSKGIRLGNWYIGILKNSKI